MFFNFRSLCGEENHLKAAIALLVNKQSATFLLRKKSGFSPPNPNTPWLVAFCTKPSKKSKGKKSFPRNTKHRKNAKTFLLIHFILIALNSAERQSK